MFPPFFSCSIPPVPNWPKSDHPHADIADYPRKIQKVSRVKYQRRPRVSALTASVELNEERSAPVAWMASWGVLDLI